MNIKTGQTLLGMQKPLHPSWLIYAIAKVVCWGEDRSHALETSRRAVTEMRVGGLPTNLAYLLRVLESDEFVDGEVTLESALGERPLTGLTPSYQG